MAAVMDAFTRWYFKRVTSKLSKMGLTYHDALVDNGVYEKAVGRLSPELQLARRRRIQRAFDLSQKHVEIPKALQEDPWREYKRVQEVFSATQLENDERKALNGQWWMPYHLGRESWHEYDTSKAWFWKNQKKIAGK